MNSATSTLSSSGRIAKKHEESGRTAEMNSSSAAPSAPVRTHPTGCKDIVSNNQPRTTDSSSTRNATSSSEVSTASVSTRRMGAGTQTTDKKQPVSFNRFVQNTRSGTAPRTTNEMNSSSAAPSAPVRTHPTGCKDIVSNNQPRTTDSSSTRNATSSSAVSTASVSTRRMGAGTQTTDKKQPASFNRFVQNTRSGTAPRTTNGSNQMQRSSTASEITKGTRPHMVDKQKSVDLPSKSILSNTSAAGRGAAKGVLKGTSRLSVPNTSGTSVRSSRGRQNLAGGSSIIRKPFSGESSTYSMGMPEAAHTVEKNGKLSVSEGSTLSGANAFANLPPRSNRGGRGSNRGSRTSLAPTNFRGDFSDEPSTSSMVSPEATHTVEKNGNETNDGVSISEVNTLTRASACDNLPAPSNRGGRGSNRGSRTSLAPTNFRDEPSTSSTVTPEAAHTVEKNGNETNDEVSVSEVTTLSDASAYDNLPTRSSRGGRGNNRGSRTSLAPTNIQDEPSTSSTVTPEAAHTVEKNGNETNDEVSVSEVTTLSDASACDNLPTRSSRGGRGSNRGSRTSLAPTNIQGKMDPSSTLYSSSLSLRSTTSVRTSATGRISTEKQITDKQRPVISRISRNVPNTRGGKEKIAPTTTRGKMDPSTTLYSSSLSLRSASSVPTSATGRIGTGKQITDKQRPVISRISRNVPNTRGGKEVIAPTTTRGEISLTCAQESPALGVTSSSAICDGSTAGIQAVSDSEEITPNNNSASDKASTSSKATYTIERCGEETNDEATLSVVDRFSGNGACDNYPARSNCGGRDSNRSRPTSPAPANIHGDFSDEPSTSSMVSPEATHTVEKNGNETNDGVSISEVNTLTRASACDNLPAPSNRGGRGSNRGSRTSLAPTNFRDEPSTSSTVTPKAAHTVEKNGNETNDGVSISEVQTLTRASACENLPASSNRGGRGSNRGSRTSLAPTNFRDEPSTSSTVTPKAAHTVEKNGKETNDEVSVSEVSTLSDVMACDNLPTRSSRGGRGSNRGSRTSLAPTNIQDATSTSPTVIQATHTIEKSCKETIQEACNIYPARSNRGGRGSRRGSCTSLAPTNIREEISLSSTKASTVTPSFTIIDETTTGLHIRTDSHKIATRNTAVGPSASGDYRKVIAEIPDRVEMSLSSSQVLMTSEVTSSTTISDETTTVSHTGADDESTPCNTPIGQSGSVDDGKIIVQNPARVEMSLSSSHVPTTSEVTSSTSISDETTIEPHTKADGESTPCNTPIGPSASGDDGKAIVQTLDSVEMSLSSSQVLMTSEVTSSTTISDETTTVSHTGADDESTPCNTPIGQSGSVDDGKIIVQNPARVEMSLSSSHVPTTSEVTSSTSISDETTIEPHTKADGESTPCNTPIGPSASGDDGKAIVQTLDSVEMSFPSSEVPATSEVTSSTSIGDETTIEPQAGADDESTPCNTPIEPSSNGDDGKVIVQILDSVEMSLSSSHVPTTSEVTSSTSISDETTIEPHTKADGESTPCNTPIGPSASGDDGKAIVQILDSETAKCVMKAVPARIPISFRTTTLSRSRTNIPEKLNAAGGVVCNSKKKIDKVMTPNCKSSLSSGDNNKTFQAKGNRTPLPTRTPSQTSLNKVPKLNRGTTSLSIEINTSKKPSSSSLKGINATQPPSRISRSKTFITNTRGSVAEKNQMAVFLDLRHKLDAVQQEFLKKYKCLKITQPHNLEESYELIKLVKDAECEKDYYSAKMIEPCSVPDTSDQGLLEATRTVECLERQIEELKKFHGTEMITRENELKVEFEEKLLKHNDIMAGLKEDIKFLEKSNQELLDAKCDAERLEKQMEELKQNHATEMITRENELKVEFEKKLLKHNDIMAGLKEDIKFLEKSNQELLDAKSDAERLEKQMEELKQIHATDMITRENKFKVEIEMELFKHYDMINDLKQEIKHLETTKQKLMAANRTAECLEKQMEELKENHATEITTQESELKVKFENELLEYNQIMADQEKEIKYLKMSMEELKQNHATEITTLENEFHVKFEKELLKHNHVMEDLKKQVKYLETSHEELLEAKRTTERLERQNQELKEIHAIEITAQESELKVKFENELLEYNQIMTDQEKEIKYLKMSNEELLGVKCTAERLEKQMEELKKNHATEITTLENEFQVKFEKELLKYNQVMEDLKKQVKYLETSHEESLEAKRTAERLERQNQELKEIHATEMTMQENEFKAEIEKELLKRSDIMVDLKRGIECIDKSNEELLKAKRDKERLEKQMEELKEIHATEIKMRENEFRVQFEKELLKHSDIAIYLKNEVKYLETELRETKRTAGHLERQMEELKEIHATEMTARENEFKVQFEEHKGIIAHLKKEIKYLEICNKRTAENLERQKEELQEIHATEMIMMENEFKVELEKELLKNNDIIADLKNNIESLKTAKEKLEAAVEISANETAKEEAKGARLTEEINARKKHIILLTEKLKKVDNAKKKALQDKKEEIETLQKELDTVKKSELAHSCENVDVRRQLQEKLNLVAELENTIQTMGKDLVVAQQELEECHEAKIQVQNLNTRIQALEEAVEQKRISSQRELEVVSRLMSCDAQQKREIEKLKKEILHLTHTNNELGEQFTYVWRNHIMKTQRQSMQERVSKKLEVSGEDTIAPCSKALLDFYTTLSMSQLQRLLLGSEVTLLEQNNTQGQVLYVKQEEKILRLEGENGRLKKEIAKAALLIKQEERIQRLEDVNARLKGEIAKSNVIPSPQGPSCTTAVPLGDDDEEFDPADYYTTRRRQKRRIDIKVKKY